MTIRDILFGKPLPTWDERAEQLGVGPGIPIFGLDALSSAAYGPEAALTLLLPLGAAGVGYLVPINACVVALLIIVFFSYRQTIAAYPGGGSYTVASDNLGPFAGLLAASALMIDYILTVAVGISAGVGALVSAIPSLLPHTLGICLLILIFITIINLRGLRQAGIVFMVPTYLFIFSLLGAIAIGFFKAAASGGHPVPVVTPPHALPAVAGVSAWLLLQSFASGCTAMTGVEAVSNGVMAFKEPAVKNAQKTLTIIIVLLIVMLGGMARIVRVYHISATDPGAPGYQSVISMVMDAVVGRGVFYYVAIGSVLLVLALSANTAFADFPRLCRAIAMNGYLPDAFSLRGRRLVYSKGVYVLAALAALLLILFGGITNRLIPLYAVGAFLAFTLSQAGMVAHWRRVKGPGYRRYIFVNGLGAVATGATVLVVLVAKFIEGAWVTAILIPTLVILMLAVKRYFDRVQAELDCSEPLNLKAAGPPLVIVPVQHWSHLTRKALEVAFGLSQDVEAVHVCVEGEQSELNDDWETHVNTPLRNAGRNATKLTSLESPFRLVITPIVNHVLEMQHAHPDRRIAVVIPEMIEHHWWHYFLENNRAELLKALLLLKGNQRIILVNVPWYLKS
jgi:amino acid transporter